MDLEIFIQATVAGVPLVFVVIGLVTWARSFKNKEGKPAVSDNGLLGISMGIGVVLGGGYMLTQTRPPGEGDWWPIAVYWFGLLIYGLAMGIVASGLYDTLKKILEKTFAKIFSGMAVIDLAKPGERQ